MSTRPAPVGQSLQNRLLWTVLGSVGLVWLLVVVATWADTRHEVDELLDAHLSQAASLLVSQPLDDLNRTVRPETPVLHEYQSKVVVQVWHQNDLVVRSPKAPTQALAPHSQRGLSDALINGEAWRVFSAQGHDEHVVVHVAEQQGFRDDVINASVSSVALPMAFALPLLGLAIWWAVRRAMRPLLALGHLVAQRPPGGLEPLPTAHVPLEAQPMVGALNRLFARTAALMDTERRFTADAAHELRTPMAAIRMQAQVAQGATDEAERAEALAATVEGCDRATHLMEQLLQLARLESADQAPAERCDLAACVATVLSDMRPLAQRRGQRVQWLPGTDGPLWVDSPAGLTTVLLRNLLDNALRYSPNGSVVRLQVHAPPSGPHTRTHHPNGTQPVRLVLHDSGPGLSPADLQRLGERFFRVLGSGEAGSGLGWSIVTRMARLYDIAIAVDRSAELGGLQVTLDWPAPAGSPA